MADHHQETKTEAVNPQDFSSEPFTVGKHLSMLRLDNSKPNPSASTLKRPSSPPSQQPNPKKEKLSPLFPGFSKITPLPPLPKTQSGQPRTRHPLFRCCISDQFNPYPGFDSLSGSTAPHIPNSFQPQSAEKDVVPNSAVTATSPPSVLSTRPPRPIVSDPSSSPAAKSGSRASSSSGDDDTPNTKRRLRRIKDCFREMTLWFEQVMVEDDEQVGEEQVPENQQEEVEEQIISIEPGDEHVQDLDNTAVTKEDCDQKRFEESVSVEKVGDCIVIHFSCHCGVPYQFLLAGGNCYYKLM